MEPRRPGASRPRRFYAAGAGVVAAVVVAGLAPAVALPSSASGARAAHRSTRSPDSGSPTVTLAGTGVPGFSGDGGPAVDARLDVPEGIAWEAGTLAIADSGNCRVRVVAMVGETVFGHWMRAGHIATVAGGPCGRPGDPPPTAVAFDPAGDLFVAYGAGDRVAELPARSGTAFGRPVRAGRLTVVAGTGTPGFGGDGGAAGKAQLDDPTGVAVDPQGDVLVSDTANCRLRLVAATGGARYGIAVTAGDIYTVAGNGICGSSGDDGPARQAELWDPGALAVDPGGDVFVADQGNRSVRVLAASGGTVFGLALAAGDIGTVAGEGSYGPYLIDGLPAVGETAELNFPSGLALDGHGDLYVTDGDMHAIRFEPAVPTTLLGRPAEPDDLYTAAGALSVGPLRNRTSWVVTRLEDPAGVVVAPGGQLVFSDSQAAVVRELPRGA